MRSRKSRAEVTAFAGKCQAIVGRIATGAPAPVTVTDACATMELAAAIYAPSVSGTTIAPGQINESSPFFRRMDGHLEPRKQEETLIT